MLHDRSNGLARMGEQTTTSSFKLDIPEANMLSLRRFCTHLVAISCLLALGGCATAVRGYRQYWEIDSTPSAAVVSLSNGVRCTAPCKIKLPRKHGFAVEVCKSGYRAERAHVASHLSKTGSAMIAGNAVLGGVVGAGTDVALGSNRDLRPDPMHVALEPEAPGCQQPAYPAVPDDGQTPAEYQRAEERRATSTEPLRYRNSHGRAGRARKD